MHITNTRNKILLIIAMIACFAIIFIDESGIAVTLPLMQQTLNLTHNEMHWVINSYLLTLSVLLLLGGKLSDIYGKLNIFTLGILIFIVASIICGFSQHVWMIISGRLLQGIGASLLMPCIMVLIHRGFPENEFGKAYGLILGFSNFFYAVGPFIGGVLTEYVSWRWFFWLNIPIGFICLYFTFLAVEKDEKNHEHFYDIKGLIAFIVSLTALIFAIMQGADWGWNNIWIIGLFIFSIIGLILFVKIELKTEKPLLDIRLFHIRNFSAGNIILFCSCITLSAMVFWALWLQTSVGLSPATVGAALLPATLTFIFIPTLGGAWRDKSGTRSPLLVGCLLTLLGIIWVAVTLHFQNYFWLLPGLLFFGFGLPLSIPNSIMTIMSSVSTERTGMASGMLTAVRQFALSFGIAILSAIIASYNSHHLSMLLNSSPVYANVTSHQVTLLLSGKNMISSLNLSQLLLLKENAQAIYTHALFFGMMVVIIFSVIGFLVSMVFVRKNK